MNSPCFTSKSSPWSATTPLDGGAAGAGGPGRFLGAGAGYTLRSFSVRIAAGVAAIVISGIKPRLKAQQVLKAETADLAIRRVQVMNPKRAAAAQEIELPATIQAFTEAPIYARTNGYLKRWLVDIGDRTQRHHVPTQITGLQV